jgi:hypothetical protein
MQHFIFFLTFESAQNIALNYTILERLSKAEHFSLLAPFVTYKENKVL